MVRLGGADCVALRRAWAAASSVMKPEAALSAPGATLEKKERLSNYRGGGGAERRERKGGERRR